MKFEELSKEDQLLVQTTFPEGLEKEASAEITMAQELYSAGFSKFASETAEALEKLAKEEKDEEEEEHEHEKKLDEGQKKEASARGAFIAKGYIDGLMKLGKDNYQDEYAYLYPFIEEKIAGLAEMGTKVVGAVQGAGLKAHLAGKSMGGMTGKALARVGKAVVENPKSAMGVAAAVPVAAGLALKGKKKEY